MQRWDAEGFTHAGVVSTKGGSDVHDACTIFSCDVTVGDEAEGTVAGVEPRNELLVREPDKVAAFASADHLVRDQLFARLVGAEGHVCGLGVEVSREACFGQDVGVWGARVGVEGADSHVVDVCADAQRRIR